jgi:hypothetical protein
MQHSNDNVLNILTQVHDAIKSCSKSSQKHMKSKVFASIPRFEKEVGSKLVDMKDFQLEYVTDCLLCEIR